MRLNILQRSSQNLPVFGQNLICEKVDLSDNIIFAGKYCTTGKNRDQGGIYYREKSPYFQAEKCVTKNDP